MVKQLNPLYLIGLLIVIVFFSNYTLDKSQKQLQESLKELSATKQLAKELVAYQKSYSIANKTKLLRYFRSTRFVNAGVVVEEHRDKLKITAKELSSILLNKMLSKIFNSNYNVKTLLIVQNKTGSFAVFMEIVW